jgi:ribosomal protein S12
MLYVIVDENNNVLITENSEKVDEFMKQKNGVYYMIVKNGNYVVSETYQVYDKKPYRIDSRIM